MTPLPNRLFIDPLTDQEYRLGAVLSHLEEAKGWIEAGLSGAITAEEAACSAATCTRRAEAIVMVKAVTA